MFKRRNSLTILQNIKNFLWPSSGWSRMLQYYAYRIKRLPGTPHAIASGFAYGAAISFTPFIGFHILLAMMLSYIMGGSIIAAAIGTAVGSPWTFPFIWMATYKTGNFLIGNHSQTHTDIDFIQLFHSLEKSLMKLNFEALAVESWPIIHPMLIGGLVLFPFVWLLFYYPLKQMIAIYQKNKGKRLARRAELLLKIHEEEATRIAKIKEKQEAKLAKKEQKKIAKEQKKAEKAESRNIDSIDNNSGSTPMDIT
ncbi:MAG: DUF2062 domain-containing protein [Alphaproteobacteria bacterium]|nr:DUF2062 domain-containing protein [Alphaproteobacteria bacterium]